MAMVATQGGALGRFECKLKDSACGSQHSRATGATPPRAGGTRAPGRTRPASAHGDHGAPRGGGAALDPFRGCVVVRLRTARGPVAAGFVIALAVSSSTSSANAFCRQAAESCRSTCAGCGKAVFWREACVGIAISKTAVRGFSYDAVYGALVRAASRWMSIRCGDARPSIELRILDATACDDATATGKGINLLAFRDDDWPYADRSVTGVANRSDQLALTVLALEPRTGRALGGRIEVNSRDFAFFVRPDPDAGAPTQGFDLDFVLTHELGHFFGLAHSAVPGAVMEPSAIAGPRPPALTADDRDALCAIYTPDGRRTVDPSVSADGLTARSPCAPAGAGLESCDDGGAAGGCSASRSDAGSRGLVALLLAGACVAVQRWRRRLGPRSGAER